MRDRTADLLDANQTLSQLSYGPLLEKPVVFHSLQDLASCPPCSIGRKRAYYTRWLPSGKGFRELRKALGLFQATALLFLFKYCMNR